MANKSKWIPVSERVPDDSMFSRENGLRTLCTVKVADGVVDGEFDYFCELLDFDSEKNEFCYDACSLDGGLPDDMEVIAWMPLPEPYKEDENDE